MKEQESESGTEGIVSDYFVFIGITHHIRSKQTGRKQSWRSLKSSSRSRSPLHQHRRNELKQIHSQDYREQLKSKCRSKTPEDSILVDMKGKEYVMESTGVIQKA